MNSQKVAHFSWMRYMINFHVIREAILSSMNLRWKEMAGLHPTQKLPALTSTDSQIFLAPQTTIQSYYNLQQN